MAGSAQGWLDRHLPDPRRAELDLPQQPPDRNDVGAGREAGPSFTPRFTVDGKLFIGKYPGTRWFNNEVKPYHNQIRKARNESSGKKINNNKYRSNNMKRKNTNINNRTKVGKLHARISELERANTETIKTKDSKIEKTYD